MIGAIANMDFGERLLKLRLEKGLAQYELAQLTEDVQPPTISRIERGITKNPGQRVVKQLADALGVSMEYLLTGGDDEVGANALNENPAVYAGEQSVDLPAAIRVPKRADQESLADIARALLAGQDPDANLRRFEKFRSYGEAGMDAILDLAEDALRLQRLRTEGTGGADEEQEPVKRRKRKINLGPEDLDAQHLLRAN